MEIHVATPEKENPVADGRQSPLSVADVDQLFLYHQSNRLVPWRPKGGEIYVYRPENVQEIKDWVADGHHMSCEGSRKVRGRSGPITKKYFYLLIKTEGKKRYTDKRFRKEVYLSEVYASTVVLHYIGDEKLSVPRPHGNSMKQTRISIRQKPSVTAKMIEKIRENIDKPAHKLYKEVVTEGITPTDKPKNNRQVHYIREKVRAEKRPTKDAIINLQALAIEEDFIHYIATYPDLVCVAGMPEVLENLNFLLQLLPNHTQFLSYDTTFSMGDFYVSALLFKNKIFIEQPVIPALFLVHERKFQSHHQLLFQVLRDSCKGNLKNVPLATDMEIGIVNAAEAETTLKVVGCWRHLKKDAERHIYDNGGHKQEALEFSDHIYDILKAESEEIMKKCIEEIKPKWTERMLRYFERNLKPKLHRFAACYISKYTHVDSFSGVTTNQSEGFNWLIKDLNNWKEGPIDTVVLSFRFLQQYYLAEIKRGRAGVGNFTLREDMMALKLSIDNIHAFHSPVCDYKMIVEAIRDGNFIKPEAVRESTEPDLTNMAKAREISEMGRIVFAAQLGCFVVIGASGKVYIVELFPIEKCTCPIPHGACCHILAVKLALKMNVDGHKRDINFTLLRKTARGKKKPGRKQPRKGDEELVPGNKFRLAYSQNASENSKVQVSFKLTRKIPR